MGRVFSVAAAGEAIALGYIYISELRVNSRMSSRGSGKQKQSVSPLYEGACVASGTIRRAVI